ncbi:kinesin-like protein Nod [Cylas formicarius]|uniref:kinesin-like protein Nod n=1 Tax=Cylas formicarius TaxID=197179 RepID=UPI0029588F53|nr:kinesin-like protein Nod [Cylas formicarius]
MDVKKECVSVSVRIRPILVRDSATSSCLQIVSKEPPVLAVPDRAQTFFFDQIFSEGTDQEQVFRKTVRPLVDHVKSGFNCTVFAYGQTGSGKTYTMGTDATLTAKDDVGIIPRSLDHLFEDSKANIDAYCSFVEIYNEKVFDLLNVANKNALNISGFVVQGLSVKSVKNSAMAKELLQVGNKNRHTGETKQNMNSSRSHAIFTIHYRDGDVSGKLNLVDLAGSECVKKTGSQGSTFQEGVNINKGLLSIGQVISALSAKSSFIPYRLSIITSILQGSLNTENFVSLIACVSPNSDDIAETLQTLDFAQRVKKIKINPEVNQIITKYKRGLLQTCRTPLKRPPQTHSARKNITLLSMPLINECQERAQSSSLSTDNSSTVSSELTQQVLSPVIRKYMTKIEASLMDHLETVVKKTFQRHNVQIQDAKNKYSTPSMSWDKIQNEVTKLVKTEFAQMSSKRVPASSSPLKNKICRILSYSPENAEPKIKEPFKMPKVPKRHKQIDTRVLPISSIEVDHEVTSCRRSLRLSIKAKSNSSNNTFNQLNVLNDSTGEESVKELEKSDGVNNIRQVPDNTVGRRQSLRIANRDVNCSGCNPAVVKKSNVSFMVGTKLAKRMVDPKKKQKSKDSPFTVHSKRVLSILNLGNVQELERLHSVGAKTAEQILLYRQLRGKFGNIEDLCHMPRWGKQKFEKFLESNFLTR